MESTSWNDPDVWHRSWQGPAVPALAQTLTFPWPEHSAQLNSAAVSRPPHVGTLQAVLGTPALCKLCSALLQSLALATCQTGPVAFPECTRAHSAPDPEVLIRQTFPRGQAVGIQGQVGWALRWSLFLVGKNQKFGVKNFSVQICSGFSQH